MTKKLIDRLEELADEMKVIVHQLRGPSTIVEDIIEFEGQQYKKVDREAREGDVVVFDAAIYPHNADPNKPYIVNRKTPHGVGHYDGATICDVKFVIYDHGRTPENVDVYELITKETSVGWLDELFDEDKSPNQQRAEVIEKAKGFVDENGGDDFHFEIDEKERQILAWKIARKGNGNEAVTGLATCHPNNVYNEYIGKAIALGRALNLDVSEFENAVQPDEVVVGMKTYHKWSHDFWDIRNDNLQFVNNQHQIINDTNAEYEVNA